MSCEHTYSPLQAKALGVVQQKKQKVIPMHTWMAAYEHFAVAAAVTGMWETESTYAHKLAPALV